MDMLQIYVVFLLKTTIYVQYFNVSGHIINNCPLLEGFKHPFHKR